MSLKRSGKRVERISGKAGEAEKELCDPSAMMERESWERWKFLEIGWLESEKVNSREESISPICGNWLRGLEPNSWEALPFAVFSRELAVLHHGYHGRFCYKILRKRLTNG